jgi:hypothetical protein
MFVALQIFIAICTVAVATLAVVAVRDFCSDC